MNEIKSHKHNNENLFNFVEICIEFQNSIGYYIILLSYINDDNNEKKLVI